MPAGISKTSNKKNKEKQEKKEKEKHKGRLKSSKKIHKKNKKLFKRQEKRQGCLRKRHGVFLFKKMRPVASKIKMRERSGRSRTKRRGF